MVKKEFYELTNPQKNIYLREEYYPNTSINNISFTYYFEKDLNPEICVKAINKIIESNDALRIRIKKDGNNVFQYISQYCYEEIPIFNCVNKTLIEKKQEMEIDAKKIFKFEDNKLYKFAIYKLEKNHTAIYVKLHHIIADAWVTKILLNQFMEYYNLFHNNETYIDIEQPSYINYINAEKQYFSSEKFNKDKAFWDSYLNSFTEAIPFKEIANKKTSSSNRYTNELDCSDKINEFCKINNITPYAFFIAVYSIYLYKAQSKTDFTIGTPLLNRKNYTDKHTVGMFVSTIPLNIHINKNETFIEFTKRIAIDLISILRHQSYPYQNMLEYTRKEKQINTNLFDTILSFQNMRPDENILECKFKHFWNFSANQQTSFEMHITDYNGEGRYFLNLDYNELFCNDNEIKLVFERLKNIINNVLKENLPIKNISFISTEENNKINNIFNHFTNYSPSKTLIDLFEETVKKHPNKIALKFKNEILTYAELSQKVNGFANTLLNNNIKNNIPVSILLERSSQMVIAMLATLKVGAYYITIDPFWPLDRINYIISNSDSSILITHGKYINQHLDMKCINADEIDYSNLSNNINNIPHSLSDYAYVIYTSGSTGKPKGTMMTNKNVVNLLHSTHINFNQTPNDIWTLFHTYTFDFSAWEIYGCLLYGGQLVVVPKETTINPKEFLNLLVKEKVSILNQTPAYFYKVIEEEKLLNLNLDNIRYVILGGEAVYAEPLKYFKEKYPNIIIYNGYGPTETTIFAIMGEITKNDINDNNIYIGYPLENYKIRILNQDLLPLGIGCEGEICISGNGVCSGYFNNPEMTKEKFITIDGETVYRSGDLGYWNYDGRIKYIGRNDNQVKIRGFRIELEEIEKELLACKYVTKAVVMPIENNNYTKSLVGFIETSKENYVDTVLQAIRRNLTSYMIPKLYQVKEMPLNNNGKIDRKKLLSQIDFRNKEIIKPTNNLEKELFDTITKIKNISNISITDDFFEDLNFDSLDIMQMSTLLSKYNVSIQSINNNSSIQKLAQSINNKNDKSTINVFHEVEIQNHTFSYDLNNVLLTGSTGFLGAHILRDLIKNPNTKKVFCLIRNKNGVLAENRFKKFIKDYFTYEDMANLDKITIINGDFEKENFGISDEEYSNLTKKISTVIHCGAYVKHYGKYNKFHMTNVIGTENVINFVHKSNAKLAHISTISVGGYCDINDIKYLDENSINIGQTFNNHVYMITKYEAECKVLDAINSGFIKAKIFRLGNIMPRITDGKFQTNKLDNGFLSRIKTILSIKSITKDYLNLTIDLSPVDLCSQAIVTLLKNNTNNTIYHILNNNLLSVKDLVSNFNIETISTEEAIKRIKQLDDPHSAHLLNDLLYSNLIETKTIEEISCNELLNLGFCWNKIDTDYLDKIFKIVKE